VNGIDTTASFWLPGQFSTMAPDVDALFYFIYYCSVFLFALVVAAMIFFVIRYRRRGKVTLTSGFTHSTPMEILWSVIPTIPIVVVFFWGSRDYVRMHAMPGNALEVKVTAQKWFWSFDYPDGASSVNELVVPVNKPVKLTMSSQDVIHCLFVPQFRLKQDILPDRYTQLWFQSVAKGTFDLYWSTAGKDIRRC
jgi:cytochrome c oxidase subunit 2